MLGYSTITSKGQITIPADMRRDLNLVPGKTVAIVQEDHSLRVNDPDAAFFALAGSIKSPRPLNFRKMRKNFIKYLGSRGHAK